MRWNANLTDAGETVSRLYIAVAATAGDGEEIVTHNGIPLVAFDVDSLRLLRAEVQKLSNRTGKTVRIVCFTTRAVHETYRPVSTGDT